MSNKAIVEAPQALIDLISKQNGISNSTSKFQPGEKIPQGQNDSWLISQAGVYRKRGDAEDQIFEKLKIDSLRLDQNPAKPYTDSDFRRIAKSASHYQLGISGNGHKPDRKSEQVADMAAEIERVKSLSQDDILKTLIRMDTVESRSINWWWYPYFAFGKTALISGDPGTAKSTVSIGLSTLMTKGGGESMGIKPVIGNVLLLSAEDDPNDTLKPRLEAMGADCERILIPKEHFSLDDVGITMFDRYLEVTQSVLAIIDPISAWFDAKVNLNASNEVRHYLAKLSFLAAKYHAIIILIRHLNKGKSEKAIYRGNASIDFTGAARSELMAVKDENTGKLGLLHIKSNIAPLGRTIGYSLTDNGPDLPPTFNWTGYSDLKYADTTEEAHSTLKDAEAWLSDRLQSGKVESNQLTDDAKKNGISFASFKRARDKMKADGILRSYKDKAVKNGPWYVELLQPEEAQNTEEVREEAQGELLQN